MVVAAVFEKLVTGGGVTRECRAPFFAFSKLYRGQGRRAVGGHNPTPVIPPSPTPTPSSSPTPTPALPKTCPIRPELPPRCGKLTGDCRQAWPNCGIGAKGRVLQAVGAVAQGGLGLGWAATALKEGRKYARDLDRLRR